MTREQKPARARKASFRMGVFWIAHNDEPEDMDPENVSGYISTLLLADLFGKDPLDVANAIVREREKGMDPIP